MSRSGLARELGHLARDGAFLAWIALTLLLGLVAVAGGMAEVAEQRATLSRLLQSDAEARRLAQAEQADWGGAGYYSFHLTYDPPSDFAFAALGLRDQEPWKHRIRALALEGQIYERDAGNPVFALTGRFDYAFFAAFVLPLILIVLLHDLQASERSAGRHALLVATSGSAASPWRQRALLRGAAALAAAALPLLIGCVLSGTSAWITALALVWLSAYVAFWAVLCFWFARWERPSAVLLTALVGVWLMLGVVMPALGKLLIDRAVPAPQGADILLVQREAVNDAWDLPKSTTMDAFIARHPQWSDYASVQKPFEWKWYYAFQQVGDQQAEPLSQAYRDARRRRDQLAGRFAWLTPPALLQRSLKRLANSDLRAQLAYEGRVRAFHAGLRAFYYDKLFHDRPYEAALLSDLPAFIQPATAHD